MTVTKSKIAQKVADNTGITRRDAILSVKTFLESIKIALAKGEKVSIVGFGTFWVKNKKLRIGRNPRSGETIEIPSKKVAYFKPGKELRILVNR